MCVNQLCSDLEFTINLISDEIPIKKGTILPTTVNITMEYTVQFEFKQTRAIGLGLTWYNILHITITDNKNVYGYYIASVFASFLTPIAIYSPVNGKVDYACKPSQAIGLNKWIMIKVSQV